MIKAELHMHTCFSHDGFTTPKQLDRECRRKGIDCVCITDHNTMRGAHHFADIVSVRVIKGEEIATQKGEVIGMFLEEEIPAGLELAATIARIKEQNGIVYLPHPFDEFRKSAVKRAEADAIVGDIDIVEIFNARTLNPQYNDIAQQFAEDHGIAVAAASDAHHPRELGRSHVLMPDFAGRDDFLDSVRAATIVSKKCPLPLRFYLKGLKILTGKS